jgi:glycosyltransferase involved in cell wall biosynthesis
MNILLLTLVGSDDINERGIYNDLIRTFSKRGHKILIVSPRERRYGLKTKLFIHKNINNLRVRTLNVQKTNSLEKGISTLIIEYIFLFSIVRFFKSLKFDLVLYSTPPITFTNIIKFFKKRDSAKTCLLLKDIFPQNAIDMELLKRGGLLHKYFRMKEIKLYLASDFIGCMSPANVKYINENNPFLDEEKIEVNPNSIEPSSLRITNITRTKIRRKYDIPENASVVIYGGNLGKPQGLVFLIKILESNANSKDIYFIVLGSGTGFPDLRSWFRINTPDNAKLLSSLKKDDYDLLVKSSDVGLILLDRRFTIPNYPSRLLSYMEAKIPILLATDKSTDIGRIAEENAYGMWSLNGDIDSFNDHLGVLSRDENLRKKMGINGYNYMMKHYTVDRSYDIIMRHFSSV